MGQPHAKAMPSNMSRYASEPSWGVFLAKVIGLKGGEVSSLEKEMVRRIFNRV